MIWTKTEEQDLQSTALMARARGGSGCMAAAQRAVELAAARVGTVAPEDWSIVAREYGWVQFIVSATREVNVRALHAEQQAICAKAVLLEAELDVARSEIAELCAQVEHWKSVATIRGHKVDELTPLVERLERDLGAARAQARALKSEVEFRSGEAWAAAAGISELLEESVQNYRQAERFAIELVEAERSRSALLATCTEFSARIDRLDAEVEWRDSEIANLIEFGRFLAKDGATWRGLAESLDADLQKERRERHLHASGPDGALEWKALAIRLLILGIMVRAQWERYLAATQEAVDLDCPGKKTCHGPMSWCPVHGDVSLLCDMEGKCDVHSDRWYEFTMERSPIAKQAREDGMDLGRQEGREEGRKEREGMVARLQRVRSDAYRDAVDVTFGRWPVSEDAPAELKVLVVKFQEMVDAAQPFLELARERLAQRSYEPIPRDACSRVLAAFAPPSTPFERVFSRSQVVTTLRQLLQPHNEFAGSEPEHVIERIIQIFTDASGKGCRCGVHDCQGCWPKNEE